MLHQNLKTKSLPSSGPKLKVTNVSIQGVPQNTRAPRPRTHARARRNSILSAEKGQATAGGGCRPRRSCSETRAAGRRNGNRVYDSSAEPGRTAVRSMREWHAAPFPALPTPAGPVTRSTDRAHGERQRAWRGHLRPDGRRPLLVLLISIDSGARCAGADLVAALMSRA